ncbi:hypothetical protein QJS04_geneDACA005748 [Acorus gramineus]|uniref:Glutamine amidotransferase domain-containing protein n=1 Tax=Acorus gramineus TaxID=55184 RepID=A0AAV9BLS4_ACOGR|nr:hypothetical protein QJS04_geneDACA005748 [Acorus gramineus]
MEEKRRFAVLLCAEDPEYVKETYGGYFGVFQNLLAEDGEAWDLYRVAEGDFPPDGLLGLYDGFVVTGSSNDAHGNDEWIRRLLGLLRVLDSMHKKVLGICFGHQILSRAIGGKTGRATRGWDIGLTSINLLLSKFHPLSLFVVECHRDEVLELPPKAEVIGWSEKTGIEAFRYRDHMMGIQGHPEYTKDILLYLIDSLTHRKLISRSHAEVAKTRLEKEEPDREAWKMVCRNFLKEKSSKL